MGKYLQQGTVLDEKYRIEKVLGYGGFAITYEGVLVSHVRTRVAIKELFLSQYVERETEISSEISLKEESDRRTFEKAKDDFLKEALILGIMNKEPAVVNVIDRFKANGTAYIVMEYVEGITLAQQVKEHGVFREKDIFQKILPLAATLEKIHENELIHGDISPDNIMYQKDGTLKLIDFGSSENYFEKGASAETIKDGYAAPEQYGSGELGPWTDIYGLCAAIYYCLTGVVPESSLQRTLYDELEKPSQIGIKMDAGLEQILWNGLELEAQNRYQSMKQMEEDIRAILPAERKKLPASVKRIGILAAAGMLAGIGVRGYQIYQEVNKFNGIETQKVLLIPEEDMTVNNFVEARQIVEERIRVLVGESPYTVEEKEDGTINIITPLEVFADQDTLDFYDRMICGVWNTEFGKYDETNGNYVRFPVSFEDFETVALQTGVNEKMSAEQSELIHAEVNKYIYLVLNEEKAAELRELFPSESILQLYLDFQLDEEIHDSISVTLSADGREMYLYGNFLQKGRFAELLTYNLSHPTFSQNFLLYGEIAADWESPDGSMLTGEYQKKENEIKNPAVTVSYSQSEQSAVQLSKGEWAYTLVNLKERLDQFQIPYAIGSEKDDPRQIVLKLEQEDATTLILDSLMKKGFTATIAGRWMEFGTPVSEQKGSMELIHGENASYRYSVRLEKEKWKDFQIFTEKLLDTGTGELFIKIGDYYIAKCVIEEPITDGKIIFDSLCDEAESAITEENKYLLDYLSKFVIDTSGFANYQLDKVTFTDETGEISEKQNFQEDPYVQDYAENFLKKAKARYPQISYDTLLKMQKNEVCIQLNVEVSDAFVKDALEMVKQIYFECELEEGWLDHIVFVLTEENTDSQEKARMIFVKDQESGKGYRADVLFQNGRMEWYKEEMEECLQKDEFFSQLLNTLNGQ